MASTLSDKASVAASSVGVNSAVEECPDLSSLSDLIASLTIDLAKGEDGFRQAMRSLLSSLYKACENDNISLFQIIMSCLSADFFPDIEIELLRSAILNGSFQCARHLAGIVRGVSIGSVLSWMCVKEWDAQTFQTLVDRGFKLEDCACKGMGVLKHCIINGNEELVTVCLQNGCSPNTQKVELPPDDDHTPQVAVEEFSPLMCAILYAKAGIVGKLIEFGASVTEEEICGMSPLEAAVYASKPAETGLILGAYQKAILADPKSKGKFLTDAQKALTNAASMTPSYAMTECMSALLRMGADMNRLDSNGCLPLLMAVDGNHLQHVIFLVQQGCDVNTVGNVPTIGAEEGFRTVSPMRLAADQSNDSILTILLQAGAVDQSNEPWDEESLKRIARCRRQFSLSDWCRVSLRKELKQTKIKEAVSEWEIPTTLKRFISMY